MSPRVTSSGFWVVIYGILSDWASLLLRLQQPPSDSPCFFFLFLLLALGGLALAPVLVFSLPERGSSILGVGWRLDFQLWLSFPIAKLWAVESFSVHHCDTLHRQRNNWDLFRTCLLHLQSSFQVFFFFFRPRVHLQDLVLSSSSGVFTNTNVCELCVVSRSLIDGQQMGGRWQDVLCDRVKTGISFPATLLILLLVLDSFKILFCFKSDI